MKHLFALSTGLLLSLPALAVQLESASNYTLELNLRYHSKTKTIETNLKESLPSLPFEGFIESASGQIKYKVTTGNDKFLVDTQVFEKTTEGKKLISEPALILVLDKEGTVGLGDSQGNELVIKATISQK